MLRPHAPNSQQPSEASTVIVVACVTCQAERAGYGQTQTRLAPSPGFSHPRRAAWSGADQRELKQETVPVLQAG